MQDVLFDPALFSGLKYNVFKSAGKKSSGDLMVDFPELGKMDSFSEARSVMPVEDFNRTVKLIMAMYDKSSPLVRMYQDVNKRILEAAAVAGYDVEKSRGDIESLFSFQDKLFTSMVIEFLRLQNSRIWTMICSNEQTFYEYQKALMSEVTMFNTEKDKLSAVAIKSKLMEDSDAISERLDRYYQLLYGDQRITDMSVVDYTPEGLARKNK
jgi:hypothetical protein